MAIVGPDGRPAAGVKVEAPAGGAVCLFCAVRQGLLDNAHLRDRVTNEVGANLSHDMSDWELEQVASMVVVEGLYAGLKVLAQVLEGSGLETDKAAAVVGAAASPCQRCTGLAGAVEVSGRARRAVEVAVGNIRAGSVFVVGTGPAGRKAL